MIVENTFNEGLMHKLIAKENGVSERFHVIRHRCSIGNNFLFYLSSEEIDLRAKSIFGKLFSFAFLPPDMLDESCYLRGS